MQSSLVALVAFSAFSGVFKVDARALSNTLALPDSIAVHTLDTVAFENQKRSSVLTHDSRAPPGLPPAPAPKLPAPAPPVKRPPPARPGQPKHGSGSSRQNQNPKLLAANKNHSPNKLVKVDKCVKAKRDIEILPHITDLEPFQLRGRGFHNREKETLTNILEKRGSDEYALDIEGWAHVLTLTDGRLANNPSVTKPIVAYTMGGFSAIYFNLRGESGKTGDIDIFTTGVDQAHRGALRHAVAQIHGQYEGLVQDRFINTEIEAFFDTPEIRRNIAGISENVLWRSSRLEIRNIAWSVQLIRKLSVLYTQHLQFGGSAEWKNVYDTAEILRMTSDELDGRKITLDDLKRWGENNRAGRLPLTIEELARVSVRFVWQYTDRLGSDLLELASCS